MLRRDPAYAEAVRSVNVRAGDDTLNLAWAGAGFAARWGLHFR